MAAKRIGKPHKERTPAEDREKPESQPPAARGDAAVISHRAADRLRAGHVWVYRSDVTGLPENASPMLPVRDSRGAFLGTALYSPTSEIALRLIAREEIASEAEWLETLAGRMRAAIALRSDVLASAETTACRLIFSEADALPGLIADKYGDIVVLQLLTKALDNDAVRIVATSVL
ncbi:MAG: SAM-dependent methyltransferase, partial [Acidobacteriaceae bacterium]